MVRNLMRLLKSFLTYHCACMLPRCWKVISYTSKIHTQYWRHKWLCTHPTWHSLTHPLLSLHFWKVPHFGQLSPNSHPHPPPSTNSNGVAPHIHLWLQCHPLNPNTGLVCPACVENISLIPDHYSIILIKNYNDVSFVSFPLPKNKHAHFLWIYTLASKHEPISLK